MNFPFSNVIEVWAGEFWTKIFVFGKHDPLLLLVTWSVIDPLELELGNDDMALLGSSNDVDLIPFDEVDVVTFGVDVPLDLINLWRAGAFGEFWLWATATVDAESFKLDWPLFLLSDRLLLPLSMEDGPEVTNDDVFPLSRLEGPL